MQNVRDTFSFAMVGLASSRQCAILADVLRERAAHQPDRVGFRFLVDGESREVTLTYGDLDRRARAIAAAIHARGGAPGERVLLMYPPGLDFISAWFGCAHAGAIAVVVPPPRRARARSTSSVAAIAGDARPAVALTLSTLLKAVDLPGQGWLATDSELEDPGPDWPRPAVSGDDIAFLQYTSGSTTTPKGVLVTHGNLMRNLRAIESTFWQASDQGSVSWLPPYHDMGLIGGILGPLYLGSPVTLMSPIAFVQHPRRWLQAITRFQGAVSGGPNFAYDLCVRRIGAEQRDGLALSSWRVAFNGAEPVNARTIREFTAYFAPCGFRPEAVKPCYGLAEATLLVSVNQTTAPPDIRTFRQADLERHQAVPCADSDEARTLVSCGQAVTTTVVVDPESSQLRPEGGVGEIWVSGPSVAKGYWNRAAETDQTFHARVTGDGVLPFLRTGDLGFLLDGELFVTGRLKDLIIIDGNNHYPQDIERTVGGSHPALEATDCAAFSVDVEGKEALVVVAAVQGASHPDLEDMQRAVRTAVSEHHDLHIHDLVLVRRGGIPRTASGKVRRSACRADYLARGLAAWVTA